jgi:Tfp pilus assembly protein PilO
VSRVRTWVLLSLLAAGVVLVGGWALVVAPVRAEAASLREQVVAQEAGNSVAETRLQSLQEKAEKLPEQEAELAEVSKKIPSDGALPDLIRALTAAAASTGIELVGVTPGTAAPLEQAAPPVPVDAAASPTAAAPVAPAAATVSAVPVSLSVTGTYYDVEAFLSALEDLPRAYRVTGLSLAPGGNPNARTAGTVLTGTISGFVYLHGAAAPVTAGSTPTTGSLPATPALGSEQPPSGSS